MTERPASSTQIFGSAAPPSAEPLGDPPSQGAPSAIGFYSVVKVLGEGGMGTVYECHDPALQRLVAVKVLKGELAALPEMKTRFMREARAMASVSSPHIVAVYAVGEDNGAPFIVMEKLVGQDLSDRLRQGPLAPEQVVTVLRDCVAGLAAAAHKGLVHRDVKPANLFVVNGRAKLTDFGLARPMDGSASVTQAGLVVGTPHYMAPELGRGAPASIASDIYALGATAFELLCARPPYPAATPVQALAAHIVEPVPHLLDTCPAAGAALAAVIERMLAKVPAARFADYAELDAALRALALTASSAASLDPPMGPVSNALVSPDTVAPPTPQPSDPALRVSGPQLAIKTKSLAVMLTDIAGYTERTSQQSREESARWLALHDELLLPVLRAFGGTLVKNIGDALLVTFTSPTDAVLCGTAIQDRLFVHNRAAGAGDRIEVRVAISAGEVRLQRGDIFGEPVNLAARLESVGECGEVLITDAVYATMNTAEVRLAPRGAHTFKGIQRPVQVYAATPDATAGALPFGGRALARVQQNSPLEETKRRVKTGLIELTRGVSDAAPRIALALRGLSRRPRLVAAALVVLAVVVALVLGTGAPRTASDTAESEDLDALIERLDVQDAGDARRRLAASADSDVDDALQELTRSGTWWQRHHALAILEERGASVDRESFAIQDLETGSSCARRRMGLMLLKRVGARDRALDAVADASHRQPDNACMLFDFPSAEAAVRGRGKGPR
ncbi:MAG: protein kinase [Deltaproteobacteria bacterium]|nr:protein kinase [Deltaproteobacteria bacterium]